ncbi:MAG TPA: SRPBCC family protein, partial [Acidimicrobiales bacterium]
MVHASDVLVAEGLRDIDLPADAAEASVIWNRTLNDAVTDRHRAAGSAIPDLNELEAKGQNEPMGYCFPHYFVLPMYSSASSYRFRPLGPEETLMEIWSLTRFPEGAEPEKPTAPEVWEWDDPRWPPIPAQDFSNLPRQQRGLHAKGFEYMRLSERAEGHLSNFERTLDGFLAGLPYEKLLPALREINVNPLERPIVDLDL